MTCTPPVHVCPGKVDVNGSLLPACSVVVCLCWGPPHFTAADKPCRGVRL